MSERGKSPPAGARSGPHYLSVAPLARGGMGSVELVLRREGEFRRLYARKRPHAAHDRADSFRAHFLREARVAGLLRHPNVVSVLDVGEDDDGPYLVMDFVDGISLAKLIGRFRAQGELIPLQVCLAVARQIADGLHAAHELRDVDGAAVALVHRDVSPQNVLVDYEGIVRVTDFGLAKALGAGARESSSDALKGKIGYMSPEQLRFEPLDRRSDLWALGVVLYETLSCERLYPGGGDGIEHVARRILDDPPPDIGAIREDASPALTELVFDLLAKDRADRPGTASEVSRRLGDLLREVEALDGVIELADFVDEHFAADRIEARSTRAAQVANAQRSDAAPAPAKRRWWPWAAAAAAIVLVAALGAWVGSGIGSGSESGSGSGSGVGAEALPASVAGRDSASAPVREPGSGPARAPDPAPEPEDLGAEGEVAPPPSDRPRRGGRRTARDRLWEWP